MKPFRLREESYAKSAVLLEHEYFVGVSENVAELGDGRITRGELESSNVTTRGLDGNAQPQRGGGQR